MDKTIEQQARELLAEEIGCDEDDLESEFIQRDDAIRAIARAFTRPAPSEDEVEAAAKRMWEVAPNFFAWDIASESVRDKYRRMARAALGVSDA